MKIVSREYKLLVQHEPFSDPSQAVQAIWDEVREVIDPLPGVKVKDHLEKKETRGIRFLDTPDHTLRRNGLVLRLRTLDDAVEYTLKCRSEDRYFAAGTDVSGNPNAGSCLEVEQKLEEDIGTPFLCRFSHSVTINVSAAGNAALQSPPQTLAAAAVLFPLLGSLQVDGLLCPPQTALTTVHGIVVEETVWKDGKFVFEAALDAQGNVEKAGVTLTLWRRGEAKRPTVAELSFKLKDKEESYSRELALSARLVFELLQRLDCARVGGITRTEYIYRDGSPE